MEFKFHAFESKSLVLIMLLIFVHHSSFGLEKSGLLNYQDPNSCQYRAKFHGLQLILEDITPVGIMIEPPNLRVGQRLWPKTKANSGEYWGWHVAVGFQQDGTFWVLDYGVNNEPMTLEEWLQSFGVVDSESGHWLQERPILKYYSILGPGASYPKSISHEHLPEERFQETYTAAIENLCANLLQSRLSSLLDQLTLKVLQKIQGLNHDFSELTKSELQRAFSTLPEEAIKIVLQLQAMQLPQKALAREVARLKLPDNEEAQNLVIDFKTRIAEIYLDLASQDRIHDPDDNLFCSFPDLNGLRKNPGNPEIRNSDFIEFNFDWRIF